jgi:hypothetical protein
MCKRGLLGIPPRATGALEATALYRKLSLTLALAMTACILIVGAGVASAQDTYSVLLQQRADSAPAALAIKTSADIAAGSKKSQLAFVHQL